MSKIFVKNGWIFALCGMIFWWCAAETEAEQHCATRRSSLLKFAVVSQRNESGHWIARVTLNHEANQGVTGPFEVDVEHTTVMCEDTESVLLATTVTAPPKDGERKGNYELVPGLGYYSFHKTFTTWYKAVQICMKEGGHLVVLNSDAEFAALRKIWDESGVSGSYLQVGINDFDKEGHFVTIFDEPLNSTGYVKWSSGEPNSGNTANCGAVNREGFYFDSYCFTMLSFFCEKQT